MISYADLSLLRFADFLSEGAELSAEDHYEWMNGLWRYEGIGFSWFGAPMDGPGGTACFELFADEVPPATLARIMNKVGLPITFGMSREQVQAGSGFSLQVLGLITGLRAFRSDPSRDAYLRYQHSPSVDDN